MAMLGYFLSLLATAITVAARVPEPGMPFESPGQEAMSPYWQTLWELSSSGWLVEHLGEESLAAAAILDELDGTLNGDPGTPYADCNECRALVALVRAWLIQGLDYWDVRDEVIELCYQVVNASEPGSRYDVLCPGTCDNYGPHFFYILNETTLSTYEVCTMFNNCDPDIDPEPTTDTLSDRRLQQQPHAKRTTKKRPRRGQRDLEGALRLVHITDIHVDHEYLEGTETDCGLPMCCWEDWGEGDAGAWGDYSCNIPPRTVELMLDFAASLQPDVLAYTGDSPPHAIWQETQWGQLNHSRWVAETIAAHFPGVPCYSTAGNHELYPTNLYYVERPEIQEFNREFGSYWTELSGFTEEQLETIHKAAYYTITVPNIPGLRVLSYNSNYGGTDNFYGPLIYDSQDFLEMQLFMEDVLTEARDNGEKVMLLGHHPSGGSGTFVYYGRFISDIARRYGDVIIQHLQGHSHADRFRMTTDMETGEAFNVQFSAPSATSRTDINPSVRLIYLDPDTLIPLDYDQYHLDLRTIMEGDESPEVELYYRASEEYGLRDLTPESYRDFVDRMEVDDELFDKYRYNERTGVREIGSCTGSCKEGYMCELRTTSYDEYRKCRDSYR